MRVGQKVWYKDKDKYSVGSITDICPPNEYQSGRIWVDSMKGYALKFWYSDIGENLMLEDPKMVYHTIGKGGKKNGNRR